MITNKAILLTHGRFADGLRSGVEAIFGPSEMFFSLTNKSKSIPDLVAEIKTICTENKINEPVIFVDLRGGSCWRVARQVIKDVGAGIVFSGVNLPMLVTFLSKQSECSNLLELNELIVSETKKNIFGEM